MVGPYRTSAAQPSAPPPHGARRLGVPAEVVWSRLGARAANTRRPWRDRIPLAEAHDDASGALPEGDVLVLRPLGPGRAEVRWAPGGSASVALDVRPAPGDRADVRVVPLPRRELTNGGALAILGVGGLLPLLALVALVRPWPGMPLVWTAAALLVVLAAAHVENRRRAAWERHRLTALLERWVEDLETA